MTDLTPEKRRQLADLVGVNPASLYQALAGKGTPFSPAECVRIERASRMRLRRWDLRPGDWHLIWPELIRRKGAPSVSADDAAGGEGGLAHDREICPSEPLNATQRI